MNSRDCQMALSIGTAARGSESPLVDRQRLLGHAIPAARARELLAAGEGIVVVEDLEQGAYPQPIDAAGQDPVYVGRIRDDIGNPGGIQMWVVSDNLRKGAALNAVQIAEKVLLK